MQYITNLCIAFVNQILFKLSCKFYTFFIISGLFDHMWGVIPLLIKIFPVITYLLHGCFSNCQCSVFCCIVFQMWYSASKQAACFICHFFYTVDWCPFECLVFYIFTPKETNELPHLTIITSGTIYKRGGWALDVDSCYIDIEGSKWFCSQ